MNSYKIKNTNYKRGDYNLRSNVVLRLLPARVCIRESRQRLETVLHTCAENCCRPERHDTCDKERHGSSDL